ncbi:hypothetical protein PHLCEN_2v12464 [Hermanssonia centrifuga]|uniref:Uncharacterized protein n=1 Tax=Hermanssonia centrifuga TaxID=98765 RepID=A0A2R6NH12_9APHY|nr:hypothetical protein PHLCEN_2v12464 [Hermanssonia centrifuga]
MGIGTGKKNEKNYSYPRERLLKVGLLTRAERISLSMAEGRPWELLIRWTRRLIEKQGFFNSWIQGSEGSK